MMLSVVLMFSFIEIANHIYSNPGELDLNLKGIWISDRKSHLTLHQSQSSQSATYLASLGWDVIQEDMPAVNFVHKYDSVFNLK